MSGGFKARLYSFCDDDSSDERTRRYSSGCSDARRDREGVRAFQDRRSPPERVLLPPRQWEKKVKSSVAPDSKKIFRAERLVADVERHEERSAFPQHTMHFRESGQELLGAEVNDAVKGQSSRDRGIRSLKPPVNCPLRNGTARKPQASVVDRDRREIDPRRSES